MPAALLLAAALSAQALSASGLMQSGQGLMRASVGSSDPMFGADPTAPVAAPGLWAAEAPGCDAALGPDPAAWPTCAEPIRVGRGGVALLSRQGADPGSAPVAILSTAYALAPAWPGSPVVLQVEVPGLLDSRFVYAAIRPEGGDARGRFTRATVWPVACPGPGVAGVGPEREGCDASTPTGVHEAARRSGEGEALVLRWLGPG